MKAIDTSDATQVEFGTISGGQQQNCAEDDNR